MAHSCRLPEAIFQELHKVTWLEKGFEIKTINAGAINQNYLLQTSTQDYFLKIFSADIAVNLDRLALFRLQQALHVEQLAPKPVYLSQENGFQMDLWLSAPPLAQVDMSQTTKVETMALLMARLHKAKPEAGQLDLPGQWRHYLQYIQPAQLALTPEQLDQKLRAYSQIWQQADKNSFCHHDVSTNHILSTEPWVLLDWEYAAYSSPWYDIASCIDVNGLSEADAQALYLAYAAQAGYQAEWIQQKCRQMMPLVKFTNRLWYAATENMNINCIK